MAGGRMENHDIVDVLIIGAGISGIGMAATLRRRLPGKSWQILEARDRIGGTWSLFRYPGARSDSDLFTFGYDFKPWMGNAIAAAPDILAYLQETVDEYGLAPGIRFDSPVTSANWNGARALWEVSGAGPRARVVLCRWLFGATGYYDYERGHMPAFKGADLFQGDILHPQDWPDDYDPRGKRIAVIGSGATAVTLVPALVDQGAQVTQVQRTPTYVMPVPSADGLAEKLRRWLPASTAHAVSRWKNIRQQRYFWLFCQKFPRAARRLIRWVNVRNLPQGFDVDTHFNPPYDPWDQRLCAVPDGDLFRALKSGRADIVTGAIDGFEADGVRMADGALVEADTIVTATGLRLKLFGGATLSLDGVAVDPSQRLVFKGMMLDGVPNFCFAVGYTNSSWTLKIGLLCEYLCKLLAEMDRQGATVCVTQRPQGPIQTKPLLDFGAGYVLRALDMLPRQGDRAPWEISFSYMADARMVRRGPIIDPAMRLGTAPEMPKAPA